MRSERLRLLVIDDEPLMLNCLKRLLGHRYDVVTVEDPDEALVALNSGMLFDAILCDVNLPEMRGPEIQAILRALDSPLSGRFIWMSGSCPVVEGPFLSKPFANEELERSLALVAAA